MTGPEPCCDSGGRPDGCSRGVHACSPQRRGARPRFVAAPEENTACHGAVRRWIESNAGSSDNRPAPGPSGRSSDRRLAGLALSHHRGWPDPWREPGGAGSRASCRAIAVDLPGRGEPRGLPGWLATTVEAVVTGVSEASLATLAETLDSRLDAAPPKLPGGSMKPQPDTMRATSENRPLRRTPRGGPGRNPGETTWTKRQLAHAQASGSVR